MAITETVYDHLLKEKAALCQQVNSLLSKMKVTQTEKDKAVQNEKVAIHRISLLEEDLKKKQEEIELLNRNTKFLEDKVNEMETKLAMMLTVRDDVAEAKTALEKALHHLQPSTYAPLKAIKAI